eukprot:TRINITY_DN37092_c0_g1_i1.p1 TRINITY_DN37092_c0_g1~~TRINITY_DN37092_c0_g1_i1.p1  ORF type:complete len:300 (-),score=45.93 TRINITY_DN37092_c0_g1_i1:29-841(-)
MAAPTAEIDTVTLRDGTSIELARIQDIDEESWTKMKSFLKENPEVARFLQKFGKNADAMRSWLQTHAIADHYTRRLAEGDDTLRRRLKALENDPELSHVFEEIKVAGLDAVSKHLQNHALMLSVSRKMGSLPSELRPVLRHIDESPINFHEACKTGNLEAVESGIGVQPDINAKDFNGITPLGYAIGADRIAVVKLLLANRADTSVVDAMGNAGIHYAAGYGRKELLSILLLAGEKVNQVNGEGLTPLAVATRNKKHETVALLRQMGGEG